MLILDLKTRLIECKKVSYYRFLQFYNKMIELGRTISIKFIKFSGMYVRVSLEVSY